MSKQTLLIAGTILTIALVGFFAWKQSSIESTKIVETPTQETITTEDSKTTEPPPNEFSDELDEAFVELEMIDGK